MTIHEFLPMLKGVKQSGVDSYAASCPVSDHKHGDRNPSLTITNSGDRILLYCFANHSANDIVGALGLKMSDLFTDSRKTNGNGNRHIVRTYDYIKRGKLLYQKVRYEPKDFRFRVPDGNGGWNLAKGCMDGVEQCLFRGEVLEGIEQGATIFVLESERDVEAVETFGLVGVSPGGAKKWQKKFAESFRGHDVIIVPHNDPAGIALAEQVARDCTGIAATMRVLKPLGDKAGFDVADWIAQRRTREELFDRVLETPEWTPATEQAPEADPEEPRFNIIHANELAHFKPAEMISGTVLVRGGMNLLFGQPEAGKSLYAGLTVAALSLFMTVLYIAAEGVCGLYLRLRALELQSGQTYGDLYILTSEVNLMDPLDCQLLVVTIREKNINPELIVFDTWARCMVGGEENSNSDMGVAIANVAMIMRAFGSTAWLLHHPTKDGRWERGAGALRGAIDSSAEITNTDGLVKLELSKLKDGERWEPQFFRILSVEVGNGRTAPCLVRSNSTSTAGEQLTEGQLKALEFLALPVFEGSGAHARDIETVGKIPHASLFRVLSALKELGLITQGKRGDPYTITDTGRAKLALIRADTTTAQYHASITGFSQASTRKSQMTQHDSEEPNLWKDGELMP